MLYFIASYIRLYPKKWFDDKKVTGLVTLFFVVCSMFSVVVMQWIAVKLQVGGCFFFVSNSNKILAVLTAVAAILFFQKYKNQEQQIYQ